MRRKKRMPRRRMRGKMKRRWRRWRVYLLVESKCALMDSKLLLFSIHLRASVALGARSNICRC